MFEFFKSGKKDKDQQSVRIQFEHQDQWQEILDFSFEKEVFVFKHSSRCGISSVVLNRFEKQMNERNDGYFYLHIQGFRDLSNWLADELKIRHESPQLLVIKNGAVIAHDSHYALLELVPKL